MESIQIQRMAQLKVYLKSGHMITEEKFLYKRGGFFTPKSIYEYITETKEKLTNLILKSNNSNSNNIFTFDKVVYKVSDISAFVLELVGEYYHFDDSRFN